MRTRIVDARNSRPVIRVFLLLLFSGILPLQAQQNFYDTDLLPAAFHQERRDALRKLLPAGTCAAVFANPVRNRTNDVDYQFVQDPDLYYLTGYTEPNGLLLIFSESVAWEDKKVNEILFIQDRNPEAEKWTGRIAGTDYVINKLGISAVALNYEFNRRKPDFSGIKQMWVKWPTDIGPSDGNKKSLNWLVEQLQAQLGNLQLEATSTSLTKSLASLREIKLEPELKLMQKAIDMSVEGLAEAIRAARPGITEYQAQAVVEYYFKHRGSEYPGYGSISGGAENSCVLHYTTNRKQLTDGDLLLMDMGAEYHGYTADITRTIPVNGKFSTEQKIIYNIVLKAQLAGIDACKAGNGFHDPHLAAQKVIAEELVKLGLMQDPSEVRRYFPHGTSHYLGLEIHDAGNFGPLKKDMVITVEPGIYIPEGSPCDKKWWNIGIRIEDDVKITDNEPVVMSGALPKSIEALEKMIAETSLFEQVK